MEFIFFIFLLFYFLVCAVLITLILMQEGKGGGLTGMMGASVGETFGYGGATSQIRKFTAITAGIFLVSTIVITFLAEGMLTDDSSKFIGSQTPAPAAAVVPTTTPTVPAQTSEANPAAEQATPAVETTPATEEATPAAETTPAAEQTSASN